MRWHRRSAVFRSSSCLCSVAVFVYLVRLFAAFFRQSLVACVLQIRSFAFQSSAVRCTFISRCSCRSCCFLRVVMCFASHPLISRSFVVTVFGFVVVSWSSLFILTSFVVHLLRRQSLRRSSLRHLVGLDSFRRSLRCVGL